MAASLRPYISKFDEAFDAGKTLEYRLTIQFTLGGFSYAIVDANSSTLIAMEAYLSDDLNDESDLAKALEDVLSDNKLHGETFKSVVCTLGSRTCALIPREVFNANEAPTYLGFLHHQQQDGRICTDPIDAADCVNIYSLSDSLHNTIQSLWCNATILHESSVFITSVLQHQEADSRVYVHVKNRNYDMAIVKEGKLLFFNNFKFNTKDDFLYFLLFAMEQQGLKGEDTPVSFSGMIRANSEIMQLCERYLKHIEFTPNGNAFKVSKNLKDIPSQYYYIPYQVL